MSHSAVSKASAILVALSLLVLTSYPAFAQNEVEVSDIRNPVRQNATSAGTLKNRPLPLKVNVENRMENIREKLASRAAALRVKLNAFKDKRKAEIAERVNTNLNRINQNQTDQMQRHLKAMSVILDKLEARVESGNPDIKDPAAATSAIASARIIIASTTATVSTQTEKDYTIQITSESRIRADAKNMRDKLHTDFQTVRKAVIEAKQAVANAIRVAKSGPLPAGTELEKESTTSGTQ